jgi:hypothetical protein
VKLHPARPVTKESNRQKGIRFYFLWKFGEKFPPKIAKLVKFTLEK